VTLRTVFLSDGISLIAIAKEIRLDSRLSSIKNQSGEKNLYLFLTNFLANGEMK
jgi:hypothetical protein